MNKTSENRDIEKDDLIEHLKPKKLIPSDEVLECPCAKNNIKPITNYDKITDRVKRFVKRFGYWDAYDEPIEDRINRYAEENNLKIITISCNDGIYVLFEK